MLVPVIAVYFVINIIVTIVMMFFTTVDTEACAACLLFGTIIFISSSLRYTAKILAETWKS